MSSVALLMALACAPVAAQTPRSEPSPRTRVSLDLDWRFHLGDAEGAERSDYDDSGWRVLDVPHDWSIEGEYSRDHPAGWRGGFLPTGIGWYRKSIEWPPELSGKRSILEFYGVYMNSDVWVNGVHIGRRPYGYASFWHDVTDHLHAGENRIAVRVDHSKAPSGRWYTGSGIYRHVWLTAVDPVHVPVWGTFVRSTRIDDNGATVAVTTEVANREPRPVVVELQTQLLDPSGGLSASGRTLLEISPGDTVPAEQELALPQPKLWSPDEPNLYKAVVSVHLNGRLRDRYETVFGVRDIEFTSDRGMLLNGNAIELQGACMHHDAGPVGAAVPDDVLLHRLRMLKAMGANAVRTSHNPFAPEFYDLADQLGLMVMDEAFDGWGKPKAEFDYGLYFDEWWERDLTDFIRRDRNHPSVVMWSIGNEVHGFSHAEQRRLVDLVHGLDPTRPVTQGEGHSGPATDVAGFNGQGEFRGAIEDFHKRRPTVPVVGTEITHTHQTRGVYRSKTWYRARNYPAPWERKPPGPARRWEAIRERSYLVDDFTEEEVFPDEPMRYQSSYDNSFVRMGVRDEIRLAERLPYLLGTFRWTAFDYLGEASDWPARAGNSGVIDLAGFPKDAYYLYQSQWSSEPMVHLLPHWTHTGKQGAEIPVVAYTNQSAVELYLNGKSIGVRSSSDQRQMVWRVPYEPGLLEAVARRDGEVTASDRVRTAGAPARIEAIADRSRITANRRDVVRLEIGVVDAKGVLVPDANPRIEFEIRGPGKLIGVENGDVLDLSPYKEGWRNAFHGKCLALVQATDVPGEITLVARSSGLQSALVTVASTQSDPGKSRTSLDPHPTNATDSGE